MKRLGLAASASLMALGAGCAFLGFNGIPNQNPTPTPAVTPTPTATASPTPTPTPTPSPTTSSSPASGMDQQTTQGKTLFDANCAGCHGADGKKDGKNVQGKTATDMASRGWMGAEKTWSAMAEEERSNLVKYLGWIATH